MLKSILLAACLMLICFILDGLWLAWIAKPFYLKQIGGLMHDSPLSDPLRLVSVFFVYVLIVSAVLYFVVLVPHTPLHPFLRGALLGLIIYGVYDLTNYATLKGWNLTVSAVDAVWGAFFLWHFSLGRKPHCAAMVALTG